MTTSVSTAGWFWRWGAPLAAGLGILAATGLASASLWATDAALLPWTSFQLRDAAVAATTFAAALLACWAIVGRRSVVSRPVLPSPVGRGEACLAAAVTATAIVMAATHLDARIRYDEARTIASYATQPLAVAASTYDDPNNHVLHTLLVWVAHHFGGWDRIVLRLPAFLSFCLLLPALWWFTRREYGPTIALVATALVGASPFFVGYATNARGNTLLTLMFVAALLCGQALVWSPNRKALWGAWAAAIALGFYTMPLMAFPAVATVAWMLATRWRRCGREGFRPFLVKTLAWSAAALALAGVLYLPALAAEGLRGMQEEFAVKSHLTARPLQLVGHPLVLWRSWHLTTPAWAEGVLFALVVAGATVRGRTCRRGGTLVLATVLAWGLLFLAHPLLLPARMAIWALLVCMISAGAGAGLVLERALARAHGRWPRLGGTPRRDMVAGGVLACVLVASALRATADSKVVAGVTDYNRPSPDPAAMAWSVAEQMRPGDYFTTCRDVALPTVLYVRAVHEVDRDVAWYYAATTSPRPWSVHRLPAPLSEDRHQAARRPSATADQTLQPRLFLFEPINVRGRRCDATYPPAAALLEAQWPDHELAAAFDDGRTYVLGDWRWAP